MLLQIKYSCKGDVEVEVKKNDIVTVVDNETKEEITGVIKEYTRDNIVLEVNFNAREVHFKEGN